MSRHGADPGGLAATIPTATRAGPENDLAISDDADVDDFVLIPHSTPYVRNNISTPSTEAESIDRSPSALRRKAISAFGPN